MDGRSARIIISGSSGFLGRHFLYQLLRADSEVRVLLLLRGESPCAALERVMGLLEEVSKDYGVALDRAAVAQRCGVILGDITLPFCGVTSDYVTSLRNGCRTEFWHLAASLNFEESQKQYIEQHNVDGTNAAIDLAVAAGCSRFVYVSTAYTCGSYSGIVTETLHDIHRSFGNAYERSKCVAENIVVRRCTDHRLDFQIFRPSIVVGLSTSGEPSGGETGLYGFVRELQRMRRALRNESRTIRVVGDPAAELNLVPVDFVARKMLQLRHDGFPPGPIYHLTGDGGPTIQQATDAICDALGLAHIEYVPTLPCDATPLERILARRITFYGSYLKDSKRFIARRGGSPAVTRDGSSRFVVCFLATRLKDRFAMVERSLVSHDGFPLRIARNERMPKSSRESVVVVNAMGMPMATLDKLLMALSPHYDVVTWESRGAPSLDGTLDHASAEFSQHVGDLVDVLDAYGVRRAHVLGWCTGADVGLSFLARHPERVASLTCLSGGFVGIVDVRLPFQEDLLRIVTRVLSSPTYARLYYDLMTDTPRQGVDKLMVDEEAETSVRAAVSCLDENLMHLTGAPLQSPEVFSRYCLLLSHYFDEAPNYVPEVSVPTFFATAKDDELAPSEATLQLAAQFPGSEVYFNEEGGHYAPCVSDSLTRAVLKFLTRCRVARGSSIGIDSPALLKGSSPGVDACGSFA